MPPLTLLFFGMFSIGAVGAIGVLCTSVLRIRIDESYENKKHTETANEEIYTEISKYILQWVEKFSARFSSIYKKHIEEIIEQTRMYFHGYIVRAVNYVHVLSSRLKYFLERRNYQTRANAAPSKFLQDMSPHKMTSKKPRKIDIIEEKEK